MKNSFLQRSVKNYSSVSEDNVSLNSVSPKNTPVSLYGNKIIYEGHNNNIVNADKTISKDFKIRILHMYENTTFDSMKAENQNSKQ